MSDTIEQLRIDLDSVCAGYRSLKGKWELANTEIATLRSRLAEAKAPQPLDGVTEEMVWRGAIGINEAVCEGLGLSDVEQQHLFNLTKVLLLKHSKACLQSALSNLKPEERGEDA